MNSTFFYLIVGLGNPGDEYKFTRHNFGWLAVDNFAKQTALRFRVRNTVAVTPVSQFPVPATSTSIHFVLAKPVTYVNQSGLAVKNLLSWFHDKNPNLIVVYDDFAIPLGTIRVRKQGSSGGHKGIKSILEILPGTEFIRIRLGIGPLPQHIEPKEFVLTPFLPEEKSTVAETLTQVIPIINSIFCNGIDKTISQSNPKGAIKQVTTINN